MAIRNTAETVFTGDAAGLLAAYQQIRQANREMEEQLREQKRAAKEMHQQEQQALREQAALQKQVAEALKSIQTPLEQLKQKRAEYRAMLEQGLITERQYMQLLGKTSDEFRKAKQNTEEYRRAVKEQQEAERRRNQEIQEGIRLMREVQTPLERYRENVKQLERAHEQGTIDTQTYNRQLALQRQHLANAEKGHSGIITKLASVAAAYVSVGAAVALWRQANQEIIEQTEQMGKKFDEMFRKFNVMSGLRGLDASKAQRRIEDIATEMAVPIEQARDVAEQLVSSGASAEEASGSALRETLATLAVGNLTGQGIDSAALTEAASQYLISQQLPVTGANIRMLGAGVQTLSETNLKFHQLPDLAKQGAMLQGKLTTPEQFAAFSTLTDVMDAPEAAVGMRNVVGRLAAAGGTPGRVAALKRLGLSTEDVDFIGEGGLDVLERVKGGIGGLPEEQRAAVMTQLFGERTVGAAQVLFNQLDLIRERAGGFSDTGGFDEVLQFATSGRNAGEQRQRNMREIQAAREDQQGDLILSELDQELKEHGVTPARRMLTRFNFRTAQFFGASADTALEMAAPGTIDRGGLTERVRDDVGLLQEGVSLQGAMLEELRLLRQRAEEDNPRTSPAAAQSR